MSWIQHVTFGADGLLPVVAQAAESGEVLMLAHANREALESTIRTGQAHYWSRSRQEIWRKGATSGHTQEVVEVRPDCDGDAVLYRVRQTGPACHTGQRSCFHRTVRDDSLRLSDGSPGDMLHRLEEVVGARDEGRPEGSYTTYLLEQGLDKILKKLGEEATEVVIAAKNGDAADLTAEAGDLLYHLLVLLRVREVPLAGVREELGRRFGGASRLPSARSTTTLTDSSTGDE